MLSISYSAKTSKLHSSQNSWSVGPMGTMQLRSTDFFFFENFFQLGHGPLNMLSTSFHAKSPKLYLGQNS